MPTSNALADIRSQIAREIRHYRHAVNHPSPSVDPTAMLRRVAELLVDAREHFLTADGEPDWKGTTAAYREFYSDALREAGLRGGDRLKVQAAIRYHVSIALRKRLPDKTIEALGLVRESARERGLAQQQRRAEIQALFTGGGPIEDADDVVTGLERIRFFARRVDASTAESADDLDHLAAEFRDTIRSLQDAARRIRDYGSAPTPHRKGRIVL